MGRCFFGCREYAGRFNNIFCADFPPRNVGRVFLSVNIDLSSVNNQLAILNFDISVEMAVHCVILYHVDHVIRRNERVINSDDFKCFRLRNGGAENQTADPAKTIDADFNRHKL